MNRLREELLLRLRALPARRPPALRRSLRDDWLYATDLPQAADRESVRLFLEAVRGAGWRAEELDGWIELDQRLDRPPENWQPGPLGPETACCLSLLARQHPDREGGDGAETREAAARAVRKLMKAGEDGGAAWEKACGEVHREWAARLRERKCIPEMDAGFLIRREK